MGDQNNDPPVRIDLASAQIPIFSELVIKKKFEDNASYKKPDPTTYPSLYNSSDLFQLDQQKFMFEHGCKITSSIFSTLDPKATKFTTGAMDYLCKTITSKIEEKMDQLVAHKLNLATQAFDDIKFDDLINTKSAEQFFNKLAMDAEQFVDSNFVKTLEGYNKEQVDAFKENIRNKVVSEGFRSVLKQGRESRDVNIAKFDNLEQELKGINSQFFGLSTQLKNSGEALHKDIEIVINKQEEIKSEIVEINKTANAKNLLEFNNLSASAKLVWLQAGVIDSNHLTIKQIQEINRGARIESFVSSYNKTLEVAQGILSIADKLGVPQDVLKALSKGIQIGKVAGSVFNSLAKQDYLGAIMGLSGLFGGGGPSPEMQMLQAIDQKLDQIIDLLKVINQHLNDILRQNQAILKGILDLDKKLDELSIDINEIKQIMLDEKLIPINAINEIFTNIINKIPNYDSAKSISPAYYLINILLVNNADEALEDITTRQQLSELINSWMKQNSADLIDDYRTFRTIFKGDWDFPESHIQLPFKKQIRKKNLEFYTIMLQQFLDKWKIKDDDDLYNESFYRLIYYRTDIAKISDTVEFKRAKLKLFKISLLKSLMSPKIIIEHAEWLLKSHIILLHINANNEELMVLDPLNESHIKKIISNKKALKRYFEDEIAAIEVAIFQHSLLSGYEITDFADTLIFSNFKEYVSKNQNQEALKLFYLNKIFAQNCLHKYLNSICTSSAVYQALLNFRLGGSITSSGNWNILSVAASIRSMKPDLNLVASNLKLDLELLNYFNGEEEYANYCTKENLNSDKWLGEGIYLAFKTNDFENQGSPKKTSLLIKLPEYEEFLHKQILHFPILKELYQIREKLLNAYFLYTTNYTKDFSAQIVASLELMKIS